MLRTAQRIGSNFADGFDSLTRDGAFNRYGPAFIAFEIGLLVIASLFWIMASNRGGMAFSPETWGDWACQYPAQMWAGLTMLGGTLTAMGLIHPANRWQIAVGGLVQAAQFTALAMSAAFTGGQLVIAIYAMVIFVPFHLLVIVGAARHGRR
jgi:hypothetical protein